MLNYKKPKFWVIVFSVIIVTVIGIGLISNSKDDKAKKLEQIKPSLTPEVESIISDDYVNDMKCTNEDIEKLIEYGKIYGIENPYIPTVGVATDYIIEIRKDTKGLTIVYPHFAITESTNEILPSSNNIRRETANLTIGDGEWWIDASGITRELRLHLDDIYIRISSAKPVDEKEYKKIAESLVRIKSQS